MIRYDELIQALRGYTRIDVSNKIPDAHYRLVITLAIRMHKQDQQWDLQQLTSVLLCLAINDGILQTQQLNSNGQKIIGSAQLLIKQNKQLIDELKTKEKQLVTG